MPENEDQDISAGAQALAETEKERFERERLTRRQALRKFGITAGMATFALFSVDDLARMVGKAMQQRAVDSKVAGQIAQEFQQAGMAFASSPSATITTAGSPSQTHTASPSCQHCANQLCVDDQYCATLSPSQQYNCYCVKSGYFNACTKAHCTPGSKMTLSCGFTLC